jgi:ribose 5-phosphate isomerase A
VTQTEREKLAAAREAATLVEPGMVVGLGSGSTVAVLVGVLGGTRPDARYVAASPSTERAAEAAGLRLVALDDAGPLDIAFDGADQVDADGWLIKGGGAAHTRERIVAAAARRFVVMVSPEKLVERLTPPVPLEILAFAPQTTLASLGDARVRPGTPPSPDGGIIADCYGEIGDPRELAAKLDATPGVVAHGLFEPELVDHVIVGRAAER